MWSVFIPAVVIGAGKSVIVLHFLFSALECLRLGSLFRWITTVVELIMGLGL